MSDNAGEYGVLTFVLRYRLPGLCGTDRDQAKLTHTDLPDMGDRQLKRELRAVSLMLASDAEGWPTWAEAWFEEREDRVQRELARRKGRQL